MRVISDWGEGKGGSGSIVRIDKKMPWVGRGQLDLGGAKRTPSNWIREQQERESTALAQITARAFHIFGGPKLI